MACLVVCLSSRLAFAQDDTSTIDACLSNHTEGQELRAAGKLLESRAALMRCSATHCPSQVIRDCLGWVEQIQLQIPSVGFRVTADGASRADVQVSIDGAVVFEELSGKAVDLDPGLHRVKVVLPPFEPVERDLVVSEGDKFRVVEVAFVTPARPVVENDPSVPQVKMHRPITLPSFIFAGVSVAAAINGAAWGLSASNLKGELEANCAPDCPVKSIDVLKQRALVADISFGVSAASLVTAAAFYFLRAERPLGDSVGVDVSWLPGGGAVGTIGVTGF